jgi:nitronate monooxygenase
MKTRVTALLGCKYPILQGAMAGLGDWRFAAAVADTGAQGMITASVSRTPEKLQEDIRNCRKATHGTFSVNLSFGLCPRIEEMLEVCITEKIPVETAMYKPDSLAKRIVETGLPWVHKAARIKDAVHAAQVGASAVILVGLEGTGFKSPEQLPTLASVVWGKRLLEVPIIAAGGIADARGFAGALGMGAEGVMMGTAFMLTQECPMKLSLKEQIIKVSPDDPRLLRRVLSLPDPKAYAEVMAMRSKMPLDAWLRAVERVNLKDNQPLSTPPPVPSSGDEPYEFVSAAYPTRMVSLALTGISRIFSVKELVDNMVRGAVEILDDLGKLKN